MALIPCPECTKEISNKADACPHCGVKVFPASKKVSGKEITSGLVVAGVLVWWLASGSSDPAPAAAPTAPAAPAQPQYVVKATAAELFKAYESNEVATDERLRGNAIQVTGKVTSVEKDFSDNAVVQLASPNQFLPVRLTLKDSEKPKAALLNKGDRVEIECPQMARIVGSPTGTDCFFP